MSSQQPLHVRLTRSVRSRLRLLVSITILLAALFVAAVRLYSWERDYLDETSPITLCQTVERDIHFARNDENRLRLFYSMDAPARERESVDMAPFLWTLLGGILFADIFASLLRWMLEASFSASARRILEPYDALAVKARQVSELERQLRSRPDAALHELKSAIDRTDPTVSGAHVETGDTQLADLERAINDLLERTNAAYRQQTRFVSDASHELRTPIAVIKGYADMLDRWGREDPAVLDEGITAIRSETAHMGRLVEQLLFLARGDSGRTQFTPEETDLSALIREIHEESAMICPSIVWTLDADAPVMAQVDRQLIKQAIRILVDNAIKYTPPADAASKRIVRLRTRIHVDLIPCIEVQDSGIGIAEADMPHVFERFFRADPARAEQSGSGLGLSIAKWIVDRHGGHFEVFSRQGIGTRITVCLPQKIVV